MFSVGSPLKGRDLGLARGVNNDPTSSPLAKPLPQDSPLASKPPSNSVPQIDGNLSPPYSSDDDFESSNAPNSPEQISQLDGVADVYASQHPSASMPIGQQHQQQYTSGGGMVPSQPGGGAMGSYGLPHYGPGPYNTYGNQQPQMPPTGMGGGAYNQPPSRSSPMHMNGGSPYNQPSSRPPMPMNNPPYYQNNPSRSVMSNPPQMNHTSSPYQSAQQSPMQQMNSNTPYMSSGSNVNQYSHNQQFNPATHNNQMQMSQYHHSGSPIAMPPSGSGLGPPNSQYGYNRQGQYQPVPGSFPGQQPPQNFGQSGSHPNQQLQSLHNTSPQHRAGFNMTPPSTPSLSGQSLASSTQGTGTGYTPPLVPPSSPLNSAPFGSVNEFKQRMISIRNEISSEDDAGAKVDPKDEDYHPESSASDTDGGNASPFKTPSRRPRTTSAPIKQSAAGKFVFIIDSSQPL